MPGDLFDSNGEEINVYEDSFLPFVEGHKGVDEAIVYDQMCGEYTVFGKRLAYMDSDVNEFQTIDVSGLDENLLRVKFKSVFGIDAPVEPAAILLFNHAS